MSQSSTRKTFSDILLDPTAIASVGSIAVHAILAANLAFFTQPTKQIKKAEPGTVKVVELTPSELQRIPQAPPNLPSPTAAQQILPPVYQPSTPAPPVFQPTTPQIVTSAPQTIPLPPTTIPVSPQVGKKPPKNTKASTPAPTIADIPLIPTTPPIATTPPKKVVNKPIKGKKDQRAIPVDQPEPPDFDSETAFNPTPVPTATPDKPKKIAKAPSPSPQPTQPPKRSKPPQKTVPVGSSGGDDEEHDDREPSGYKPSTSGKISQNPIIIKPGTPPKVSSSPTPTNQPPGDGETGGGFYGKYVDAATIKLQDLKKKYPDIKIYPPKSLQRKYPDGMVCPKVKQSPFIVYGVSFDKVPDNKEGDVLGTSTAPSIDGFVFADEDTPEKRNLSILAKNRAIEEANTADQNRAPADKGKKVLYQYRVEFDPTSCKK
jgi:hypothetical protein